MVELPSGTVTCLFTDLEGSTRLWEEYPDAMRGALARHDEILREVRRAEGTGCDLILHGQPHRVEPVLEAHRVRDVGCLGRVEHVLRVARVDRNGLLAQHVLAGLDRGDGLLGMELHRGATKMRSRPSRRTNSRQSVDVSSMPSCPPAASTRSGWREQSAATSNSGTARNAGVCTIEPHPTPMIPTLIGSIVPLSFRSTRAGVHSPAT
jgi:hypothetical protein